MSNWKVFLVVVFGCVCLGLAGATVVVPLAAGESKWLWLVGLLFATLCTGTVFAVFLKKMDRTF